MLTRPILFDFSDDKFVNRDQVSSRNRKFISVKGRDHLPFDIQVSDDLIKSHDSSTSYGTFGKPPFVSPPIFPDQFNRPVSQCQRVNAGFLDESSDCRGKASDHQPMIRRNTLIDAPCQFFHFKRLDLASFNKSFDTRIGIIQKLQCSRYFRFQASFLTAPRSEPCL